MSASAVPVQSPAPQPDIPNKEKNAAAPPPSRWQKYVTPVLVLLLAVPVVGTVSRNLNSWEGGAVEQVTDDAYVRGDLTPLSTKVPGIVREVKVSDFQQVHKGDLIAELEDSDYLAQEAKASAGGEEAKVPSGKNR